MNYKTFFFLFFFTIEKEYVHNQFDSYIIFDYLFLLIQAYIESRELQIFTYVAYNLKNQLTNVI